MKHYITKYIVEDERINDDLKNALNTKAEEGYVLHSVVPYLADGTTKGCTLIFEKDVE